MATWRAAAIGSTLLLLQFAAGGEEPPGKPDPVIEKARSATASFLQHLPNYVCLEVMTRYTAGSRTGKWRRQDVITTQLVYEDGREDYRNITVNGKATGAGIEALPGNWSVGEFATDLAQVFSPVSDAEFRLRGEERLAGRDAFVYDYSVRGARSQWWIANASRRIAPAYGGSIWIDKETSRLLRTEKETEILPRDFPWDKVECRTQYAFVRLGTEEVLLPAQSAWVSCERRVRNCIRNVIDFQEYRKFAGESTIRFKP